MTEREETVSKLWEMTDPFHGGVSRIESWPEGLVLWHEGRIVWKSWPAPTPPCGGEANRVAQIEMIADLIEKHTYVMSRHNPAMARVAGHNATATVILAALTGVGK